ncbi:NXPE family member 3, partial [Biomphalaria glabrata]
CCVFYYEEIMKPAPQSELFPWEKYYLSTPLLQNISDISQAAQSSISFLSSPGSDNTFTLGSEVRFKVELYNGRKERMTR